MRAVLNRETVVRLRVDDEGGALVDADALPSVVVTAGDGSAVTSGASVKDTATSATGVYKFTVPAQTKVDSLQVAWSYTVGGSARTSTTQVDVVGQRLVELWRLREDSELSGLTTTQIQRVAEAVEEWFKSALRFPPVLEAARVTWQYGGGARLIVPGVKYPKTLYSLVTSQVAYTSTELANIQVTRHAFEWVNNVGVYDPLLGAGQGMFRPGGLTTAWVAHAGPWTVLPEDLVRAASVLARYISRTSNYPERASQVATEGAVITFSTPSPDKPTGLPEVDTVVNRYRNLDAL